MRCPYCRRYFNPAEVRRAKKLGLSKQAPKSSGASSEPKESLSEYSNQP